MIVELQLFQYRIVLTAAKTEVIEGVYSSLDNDNHFLMWDFDDIELDSVIESLASIQSLFILPKINILETEKGKGYHAYCLYKASFKNVCAILALTHGIDMRYYTAGVMRHKWTLRIGEKSGRYIKAIHIINSDIKETVAIEDIKNFCTYKTPGDNHKTRIFKLGAD